MSPDLGVLRIKARMYRMYRDSERTYVCACAHARMCGVSSHPRYIRYISSFSVYFIEKSGKVRHSARTVSAPELSKKRYAPCAINASETAFDLGKQQWRCVPFSLQNIRYAAHHSRSHGRKSRPRERAITATRCAGRERSTRPELLTTKETTMRTQTIAPAINTLSGLLSGPQAPRGGFAAVVARSATRAHLVRRKVNCSHEVGRTGPALTTFRPVA